MFGKLFGSLFEHCSYRIYRIDLRSWRPRPQGREDSVRYRLISPEETGLIEQIERLEDWLEDTIAARLRAGAICLAALDGSHLAGFNLVSFGPVSIPLLRMERTFPVDCAWSEQITVHPDYRGRGIAPQLRYRMFAELKQRGIRRFYGGALSVNQASLALASKVGFELIVEVHHHRILGRNTRRYQRLKSHDRNQSHCQPTAGAV